LTSGLFDEWTSVPALRAAALRAAQGKRERPDAAAFLFHLETRVLALSRALRGGTWQPGPYRMVRVHEPKARNISIAPFADRVVRGGSFNNNDDNLRLSARNTNAPGRRNNNNGLRLLARTPRTAGMGAATGCTQRAHGVSRPEGVCLGRPCGAGRGGGGFFSPKS
jgi:hypothetical protein